MITEIAVWYATLSLIGLISFPIGWLVFAKYEAFAYPLHRTIGLLIVSFLAWIFSVSHLISFSLTSIIVSILILSLMSAIVFYKKKPRINKNQIIAILKYEGAFLALLVIYIIYKSYKPNIAGIEKFPDYMILNTVMKTSYMPALDPWLSGATVNYYYFGQFITATLSKLSNLPTVITYNLMLSTVYALFTVSVFWLAKIITKKYWLSLLAVFVAAFMSNTASLVELINKKSLYWWDGARVIPGTINEFPLYSMINGDLHAHFLNLPIVCLIIALLVNYYYDTKSNLNKSLIGFSLGIAFMTNSWDFIIYSGLFLVISAYNNLIHEKNVKHFIYDNLKIFIIASLTLATFYLNINVITQGFHLVTGTRTTIYQLLGVMSFQLFVIAFYIFYRIFKEKISTPRSYIILTVVTASLVTLFSQAAGLVILLLSSLLTIVIKDLKTKKPDNKQLINLLVFFCLLILLFCEFFYLKDIYGEDFQRANTVFKFHYQFWIVSSIIVAYIVSYFIKIKGKARLIFFIFGTLLLVLSSITTPYRIYDSIDKTGNAPTLDGLSYMKSSHQYNYQAINWINKNINGQHVMSEYPGESFSDDSSISVFTAQITPLGWFVHEWLWHGNPDRLTNIKLQITKMYESSDAEEIRSIVNKYKIEYIYVGENERTKTGKNQFVFSTIYPTIYKNSKVQIYKTSL